MLTAHCGYVVCSAQSLSSALHVHSMHRLTTTNTMICHEILTSCSLLYCLLISLWVMSQATWYHSKSSSKEPAARSNCRLSCSLSCRVNTWDFPFFPFFTRDKEGRKRGTMSQGNKECTTFNFFIDNAFLNPTPNAWINTLSFYRLYRSACTFTRITQYPLRWLHTILLIVTLW